MDPIKIVVDVIFSTAETKFAGHPMIADFLKLANQFVDADALPLIEEKLKAAGISISM